MPKRRPSRRRYSAALLFQCRVVAHGVANRRRICETRIIHFQTTEGRTALRYANKRGHQAEHKWKNRDGSQVFFEFVGVRDLIGCDPVCEPDEVWYQIVELITPMERRRILIPSESKLCAIRNKE